jgi:NAD(P) transhydrogenase subunit beta
MDAARNLAYLISAVFFIFGLKGLTSPRTARRGNLLAVIGMAIAIFVTLLDKQIIDFTFIIVGIIVGSAIGAITARRVQMTAIPQMVAIFNGFGGGASALVALAEYNRFLATPRLDIVVTIVLSVFVGALTLTGSFIAFAKLQDLMKGTPIVFKFQQALNALLGVVFLVLAGIFVGNFSNVTAILLILVIASALGVLLVIPIGSADMPVVICLLNAYSGIAAAMTGFVLSNVVLIVSGALVGASGLILTHIMCVAMNRSLVNVVFGAVGVGGYGAAATGEKRYVTEYTEEDAAMMLEDAQSVIIIPGYGLAVAQAQFALHEMAQMLIDRGTTVRYAVHPVAGRMPGHMNVLLAEANVPYDLLLDLDEINDDFQHTDVALIIGANDVINPAARTEKDSPLYGMPILNADQAQTVIICKRSLSPGFSGVDNKLFYDQKTMMIFGDGKASVQKLVNLIKG